jgi:UDP-glucose 4-epimerase
VRGDGRDPAILADAMVGTDALSHMAVPRITTCTANRRAALYVTCDGSFNDVAAA